MSRRFLQRKEPDWHAIILFRYFDYETSGSPRTKDDDQDEDESSISVFTFYGHATPVTRERDPTALHAPAKRRTPEPRLSVGTRVVPKMGTEHLFFVPR